MPGGHALAQVAPWGSSVSVTVPLSGALGDATLEAVGPYTVRLVSRKDT
jgi:hypothetical protein